MPRVFGRPARARPPADAGAKASATVASKASPAIERRMDRSADVDGRFLRTYTFFKRLYAGGPPWNAKNS
jgi:hypothetical protein